MPLPINLIITLVIAGIIIYLIDKYLPMDGKIKGIINVFIVIAVILGLLRSVGMLG